MLRNAIFIAALLAPVAVFAAPNEHALANANEHASFNAPEIDGSNLLLGIALVGGVLGFLRKSR